MSQPELHNAKQEAQDAVIKEFSMEERILQLNNGAFDADMGNQTHLWQELQNKLEGIYEMIDAIIKTRGGY